MRVSPEKSALQALERELALYEKQLAATSRPPHRRPKRIILSGFLMLGIGATVLALAWPNMSVRALWGGWSPSDQGTSEIAELKTTIDEVSASQRELAASVAVLQAENSEIRATLQKQTEYYWYSHSPALLFKNPFPPRTPSTSPR
jgi:hypothetical protein